MKIAKIVILVILAMCLILLINYKTKHDPEKAKPYLNQGKTLFGEGKIDDAIAAYEKGINENSCSSEGHNLLGIAYRSKYMGSKDKKFLNKTVSSFKKSIDCDPKNWYPYINLGTTYYYTDKKQDAVPYLKKGLEVNPQNPEAAKIVEMIDEGTKAK